MKRRTILSYVLVITMIAAMLSACGKEKDTEAENVLDSTISSEIATEAAVAVDDVENRTESESEEPTETTESTEPDKTTEAPETAATTEPASESAPEQTTTESVAQAETAAPEQTEELPGINRNGRYPDIPESVLPASVIGNYTFRDEPRKVKVWEDLLGQSQLTNIYTDYTCTTILKPVEKDEIFYELTEVNYGGDGTPGNSTDALALYNDQYVFISDPVFQDVYE